MNPLFWYPVQGVAAVTLGVAAGLLTRALFNWLDARRNRGPTLYYGHTPPKHPREGDIWIDPGKNDYQPDPRRPYSTKEQP